MTFQLKAIAGKLLTKSTLPFLLRGLFTAFLIACLTWTTMPVAYAQTTPALFKQVTDNSKPEDMSPEELARLDDPFFNLVIKDGKDVNSLASIIQELQPEQQKVFVVHERVVDDAPKIDNRPASRRGIVTFSGTTKGEQLEDNVSLSVFFNSESFPNATNIEAMSWNDKASQFNYYKLDQARSETQPSWKFRGSSKDADQLSSAAREGTCMACHINGGMVMKEFKAPWNNWHSVDFDAGYLQAERPNAWPIAVKPDSPLQNLDGARFLEFTVDTANIRFNERRIAALKNGNQVVDAKRLLKPLFVTTEFNLMSSFSTSADHPFGNGRSSSSQVDIPLSFFLNSDLLSRGLEISASELNDFTTLSDREYQEVVRRGSTSLGGKTPGDTHFAWFTPEASAIDNAYVSQLIEQGIVPQEFVAAVMSVDLESPVFSADRERLWTANNILPSQFKIGRRGDLIAQTVRNLEQLQPAGSSPEGQFLAALKSPSPLQFLQAKVDSYIEREQRRFNDPQTRPEEIARLYRKLLVERQQIQSDPVQKHLIESSLLFPSGNVAQLPETVQEPAPSARPILARGDRGDAVVKLQQLLQQLGFLRGAADGDFGPGTERAVIAAQRSMNLAADGIVGPLSWSTFEQIAALPVLSIGAKGDDVLALQRRLQQQGVLTAGGADGDFGPGTRRAVIAAQRQFGLEADGIVGPATWAHLPNI